MHAILSYHVNRPIHTQTRTPTHKQTGPITIHCTAASTQCKNVPTIFNELKCQPIVLSTAHIKSTKSEARISKWDKIHLFHLVVEPQVKFTITNTITTSSTTLRFCLAKMIKSAQRRRKHRMLVVVRQSQNFFAHRRPPTWGCKTAKI